MAVYVLPLSPKEQFYSFEHDLDGVQYRLTFRWNSRASLWFMKIELLNGTKVQQGTPVTVRSFLTRMNVSQDAPLGHLFVNEIDGSFAEAGQYRLGDRVEVLYVDLDSVRALATA